MQSFNEESLIKSLENGCSACGCNLKDKSIHLIECHKHVVCQQCLSHQTNLNMDGKCFVCAANPEMTVSTSGSIEDYMTKWSKMNLFTPPGLQDACVSKDLRTGIAYTDTYDTPPVEDMWEPQTDGTLAVLTNKPKPQVVYIDNNGAIAATATIPGVATAHFGLPLSLLATAFVVQKIVNGPIHLSVYNVSPAKGSSQLLRLFSERHPEHPRSLFEYDDTSFGIYSRKPNPNITIMGRENYDIQKNIKLQVEMEGCDKDRVAVDSKGNFFISSTAEDGIFYCDKQGKLIQRIGSKGSGYKDPPGKLCGPMGIGVDGADNVLVGVLNGSLNLYADGNWTMIKLPCDTGIRLIRMFLASGYIYIVTKPKSAQEMCLVKYKIIL